MHMTGANFPEVSNFIEDLNIYKKYSYRNMLIYYIERKSGGSKLDYTLLEDALKTESVEVKEESHGGSVPYILIENSGEKDVLLVDGEVLIGAKQNRVVNTTVMVGKKSKVKIPVSCIEQGRWSYSSSTFSSGSISHIALRRQKSSQVTNNLRRFQKYASDQAQIWSEVSTKSDLMHTSSSTSSLHDVYLDYQDRLQEFRNAFPGNGTTIGFLVVINGIIQCADIFDKPSTLTRVRERIIEGYALDALEIEEEKENIDESPIDQAWLFLKKILNANAIQYQSVGLGSDIRFENNGVLGACLTYDNEVVHMGIFNSDADLRKKITS